MDSVEFCNVISILIMATTPERCIVHPIVLLSVVDHFRRTPGASASSKRVVGILLGHHSGHTLDIASSFAVPFEEDPKHPNVFFLDHNYVETMLGLLRKVNAKEVMVGWYTTGKKLRASDGLISDLLRSRFHPQPVALVVDVDAQKEDAAALPCSAYIPLEEIHDDGRPAERTFQHLPVSVEAEEAEEVGVEHLLRDVNSDSVARIRTLSGDAQERSSSLLALADQLHRAQNYLRRVEAGELPPSPKIIFALQEILNVLPEWNVGATADTKDVEAIRRVTHDDMMIIYLSTLIRSTIAMHGLIDNQLDRQREESAMEKSKLVDTKKEIEPKEPLAVEGK